MDLPYYYVDSAVTPPPIERRIEEFNTGRVMRVPSSTAEVAPLFLSSDLSPSSSVGAFKVELRFDGDSSVATSHLAGDPEDFIEKFSTSRVEPITAKMIAVVKWKAEAVSLLDKLAVDDECASRVALRAVIDDVEDFIRADDFWSLNQLLLEVQPANLRKITSVAYLRTTFRVNSRLSNWGALYDKVYTHLNATNQDASRALRGLKRSKVSAIA